MMKRLMVLFFGLIWTVSAAAETRLLIPAVKEAQLMEGSTSLLFKNTPVTAESADIAEGAKEAAVWLASVIQSDSMEASRNDASGIHFAAKLDRSIWRPHQYKISIRPDSIRVTAGDKEGFFNGAAVLIQLYRLNKSKGAVECAEISDFPDFKIRGYMHDVGRNFQTVETLKDHIALLAEYRLNVFHWHLTDNPAWRIESKLYPILNTAKNHRPGRNAGSYYTFDEIREVIRFANARGVSVIPELDMPGHSKFFRRAFKTPMHSRRGMRILEKLIDEFCREIPVEMAPMIHIGSDEVRIPNKEKFMKRMADKVKSNGRTLAVWNPGLEPPAGTALQIWHDAAVRKDWENIDSAGLYTSSMDPLFGMKEIFSKPICGLDFSTDSMQQDFALGAILCNWNDVRVAHESEIYRNNPIYTASLLMAQRSWNNRVDGYDGAPAADVKLSRDQQYREAFAAFEKRVLVHRDLLFQDRPFFYLKQSDVHWKISPAGSKVDEQTIQELASTETSPERYDQLTEKWDSIEGQVTRLQMRYTTDGIRQGSPGDKAVLAALIYSDSEREIELLGGFELPYRPNRRYGGVPEQGSWCNFGSRMLLNGAPVPPPVWEKPGEKDHSHAHTWHQKEEEDPWTAEELYWTRKTTTIRLKKGWNSVVLESVLGYDWQNWIAAFIPVVPSGNNYKEVPGLTWYHPEN